MKATQETIERFYKLFVDQNKALQKAKKFTGKKDIKSCGELSNLELKQIIHSYEKV